MRLPVFVPRQAGALGVARGFIVASSLMAAALGCVVAFQRMHGTGKGRGTPRAHQRTRRQQTRARR